jgi:ribokinase
MFDFISIGSATVDVFLTSKNFKLIKDDETEKGALYQVVGSKVDVDQKTISSGGGATNSAVCFSRLGFSSSCLARFGQDIFSQFITKDLKDNQVDTSLLLQYENEETDYSTILVDQTGGRTILISRGNTRLEESDIDFTFLQSRWFYISSLEGNLTLLAKLLTHARQNNIKVALNPGLRELEQQSTLIPLLKGVDVLILNTAESELLTQKETAQPDFWTTLLSYGAVCNIVTQGRDGAHLLTADNHFFAPILTQEPVDETGAGDAFGSAFTAGLALGFDLRKSFHLAFSSSASVVMHLGAKTGLLKKEDLLSWLEKDFDLQTIK